MELFDSFILPLYYLSLYNQGPTTLPLCRWFTSHWNVNSIYYVNIKQSLNKASNTLSVFEGSKDAKVYCF